MIKLVALAISCLCVFSCAVQPWQVSDGHDPSVFDVDVEKPPEVASVTIINRVEDYVPKSAGEDMTLGFGNDKLRIYTDPPASKTVEKDLREYFRHSLSINESSPISLRVVIDEAVAYRSISSAQKIPIVGLLAVTEDTEWGLDLQIHFEVEENGRIQRTYPYHEVTTILGESTTMKVMQATYLRLMDEYRKDLFERLNEDFIHRYL